MFKTLVVAVLYFVGSTYCCSQEIIAAKQIGKPNNFEAQTPYGTAVIEVRSPIVYLPEDKPETIKRFLGIGLRKKDGNWVPITGNFFATEPVPTKFGYADSAEYSIERVKTLNLLQFKKPGKVMFAVDLGSCVIHVPISVEPLPFKNGMPSDDLIETLGIPFATRKFWVKWPSDEFEDTIFYTVSAKQSIRSIEHWAFDKYPYCMFAIEDEKVIGIHSVFVDEDNKQDFKERWENPVKDAKEKEEKIAELKAFIQKTEEDIESMKDIQDNAKKPVDSREFETFHLVDGTDLYATFVDYKNAKVMLDLHHGGERLQLPLSKFSPKSSARIRELFKNKAKKK